ncbi:MAG TPA: hypothetical protein VIG99_20425 [Myxococcaceae bacterium]
MTGREEPKPSTPNAPEAGPARTAPGRLPAGLSQDQLQSLASEVDRSMRGLGVNSDALLGALRKLPPEDAGRFREAYQQQFGQDPVSRMNGELFLSRPERERATAYANGQALLGDAIGLHTAFAEGDGSHAKSLLQGGTAGSNAGLMKAYADHYGRDLEYDMRGFAIDPSAVFEGHNLSPKLSGLKGEDLKAAFSMLHGPEVAEHAQRIAQLTTGKVESTPEGRKEIYGLLSRAGGEERQLLADQFKQQTGKDLTETLKPVFAAAAKDPHPPTDPSKTVAIVVSSGNWGKQLDGSADHPVGGYHWREVEGYVKEALDHGYTPVIYTVDGLPPSPDANSLLQNTLGYKFGFGTAKENGPGSPQGQAILEAFQSPRPIADFDPKQFAALHVAGGHGSNQDLVGNKDVERAGLAMHDAGKVVTAVCHATPSLGKLLEGSRATGFSPQLDAISTAAGYVLPEFNPTYDAHQGLRQIGATVDAVGVAKAFANPSFTELVNKDGVPVMTGTGPEATDDVARFAFGWLAQHPVKGQ